MNQSVVPSLKTEMAGSPPGRSAATGSRFTPPRGWGISRSIRERLVT